MRYNSLFTTLLLFICLFSLPENLCAQNSSQDTVFASNIDEIMRNKVQTEVTIVTSATKMEQSLAEAPNLLSIVRRRQIIDFGYISLNNLTWNLPGFSMSKDYDRNTISARGNYEGWNANHILKLIDGIPFNENMYGSAMTSEVTPLVFVKSVEVMRGAGSALYGTNAMNGLLNIKTISPADLKGNVEVRSRIATDGTQIYDAIAGVNDNRLSLVAAFNHYYTHGNVYESYDGSGRLDAAGNLQKFTIQIQEKVVISLPKLILKANFQVCLSNITNIYGILKQGLVGLGKCQIKMKLCEKIGGLWH